MASAKWKYSPDNPASHYLQVRHSIYFLPAADFVNYRWKRMANLVQSITCFYTAICLHCHINCLGSVWRNTVSCSAPLCYSTACSTDTCPQVDVLPELSCQLQMPAKTKWCDPAVSVCICVCTHSQVSLQMCIFQ